jgi:class 3 adenylate cyclase
MKRKIAAILAADIAGYSKLVAEDEEETLRRLASYRSVFDDFIAKASGRIFNTAGDAVLAEFPSAVDAVRCAIDIQESLRTRNLAYPASRQMNFRMGITVGDVVEREGDLLGDGVNIAARLQTLAEPGGICVSRSIYEQVTNKLSVHFADIGEQQVKNIPTPIHAYMVAVAAQHEEVPVPKKTNTAKLVAAIAVLCAAVLGGAGGYYWTVTRVSKPARTATTPAPPAAATPTATKEPSSAALTAPVPAATPQKKSSATPPAPVPAAKESSAPAPPSSPPQAAAPATPPAPAKEPSAPAHPPQQATARAAPPAAAVKESSAPPKPPQAAAAAARPAKTYFNETKLRALAAHESIPLPHTIDIVEPAASLPKAQADFLGAWGGDRRWGGRGRQIILLVTSVDAEGKADGVIAYGPPTRRRQSPANYLAFVGTLTGGELKFETHRHFKYQFKLRPDGLMEGRLETPDHRHPTITIERLD